LIQPDEVYLASFPFGDAAGMKLRPVLTLTGPVGPIPEVLVAYISSVVPSSQLPTDIVLDPSAAEFRSTNLKTKSVLRLHKLATIHASVIVRRLGTLSTNISAEVDLKLRSLLALEAE
jgi:mRNA-degrading endonuclease toxin of MazEF toxin-antitoxin module